MKLTFHFLIFIFAFPFISMAIEPDSTFIRRFDKKSSLALFVKQKNIGFVFSSDSIKNLTVNYKPNIHSKIGATLSWRGWSASLSLRIPQSTREIGRKGKTDYWDYTLSMQTRLLGLNGNIGQFQGFYISNPGMATNHWVPGDTFPSRRDMVYHRLALSAWLILNPKHFSIKSIVQQSELQKRSAGSFSIGFNLNAVELSSDSTLIPASLSQLMPDIQGLNNYKIQWIGMDIGYYYTFVLKRFFFSPFAGVGMGGMNQNITIPKGELKINNFFSTLTGKVFSGLNFDRWFCGFSFETSKLFTDFNALNWNEDFSTVKVQGGIRF